MKRRPRSNTTPKVEADAATLRRMAEGGDAYAGVLKSPVTAPPLPAEILSRCEVIGSSVKNTVPDKRGLEKIFMDAPDYIRSDLVDLLLECRDRVEFHRLYRALKEKDKNAGVFRFLPGLLLWLFHCQTSGCLLRIPAPEISSKDKGGWRIVGCSLELLNLAPVPRVVVVKGTRQLKIDLVYIFQALAKVVIK